MRNALRLLLLLPFTAGAQSIQIRTLGPVLATSAEQVGPAVSVRGTSDGHVIVGSGARQRVYAFDSTLQHFTMVVDSGTGTGILSIRTTGLIPYLADSTLLPDFNSNALQVLDASGKQIRSMAPPNAKDLTFLGIPAGFGRPGVDPKGRLVYRTMVLPAGMGGRGGQLAAVNPKAAMMAVNADSAPIVRGDFDTRTVDTVAWMKTPQQGRMSTEVKDNPAGGPPNVTIHMVINPFSMADEWAVLTDGSVAVVRVHDYHIDWVDADGTKRASPKMPIDWRRYSDSERTQRVDSIKKVIDDQIKTQASKMGAAMGIQMKFDIGVVPDSEFPQFWPPVEPGSVLADLENHLWVLPTTSTNAANGFTYDVINREGKIFERVQLPKGRVLAGFGPHDVVYMTHTDGKNTYLERAMMNAPPK